MKLKKGKLQNFINEVNNDPDLQERLHSAAENYNGDKTNIEKVVENTIIPIASEMGYKFSAAEYIDYLKKEVDHRLANIAIPDDDLFKVSGGIGTVDMQDSEASGDVTIVDASRTYVNVNIIITGDTSPETLIALGNALNGH